MSFPGAFGLGGTRWCGVFFFFGVEARIRVENVCREMRYAERGGRIIQSKHGKRRYNVSVNTCNRSSSTGISVQKIHGRDVSDV